MRRPAPATPDERVERTSLPSGLRVLTDRFPDGRSVAVVAAVGVGSRHDPADRLGLAHLLEHTVFRRTRKWTAAGALRAVEAVGGDLNAWTTAEETVFEARVPAAQFALAVDLIGELIAHPQLRAEDLAKERPVLLEELRLVDDEPGEVAHQGALSAVFGDHPLGRPVEGTPEGLSACSEEDLRTHWERSYRPGGIAVAVAGPPDHDEVVAAVRSCLDLPLPETPPLAAGSEEVPVSGDRVVLTPRPVGQTHLVLAWPGPRAGDPGEAALDVALQILVGGQASRLVTELREERGLVYGISVDAAAFTDAGIVTISTGTAPESAAEVVRLVRAEMERLAADGPSAEELEVAVGYVLGSTALGRESTDGRVGRLLGDELTFGRIRPWAELEEEYRSVDGDGVRHSLAALLGAGTRGSVAGPVAAGLERELSAWTDERTPGSRRG